MMDRSDIVPDSSIRRVWNRLVGACKLAWKRCMVRGLETAPGRIWLAVVGVMLSVALLLVVTGLGLGIATPMTETGADDEYWIVPQTGGGSPLVAAGDPQFGNVHEANDRISSYDGVTATTPVLVDVLAVETPNGEPEYVVAVGVIPSTVGDEIMGISTGPLRSEYSEMSTTPDEGQWSGVAVINEEAASVLDASPDDSLTIAGESETCSITPAAIGSGGDNIVSSTPMLVMELRDLQTVTGADEFDQANQFVVTADSASVTDDLETIYPDANVYSSSELLTNRLLESDLGLALSVTAVVVAIAVGMLFVTTTMTLEVAADRHQLLTLGAIGVSRRTRIGIYTAQTLILSTIGGLAGVILGFIGIRLINAGAAKLGSVEILAIHHPAFSGYGFAAALTIGIAALPAVAYVICRLDHGGAVFRE